MKFLFYKAGRCDAVDCRVGGRASNRQMRGQTCVVSNRQMRGQTCVASNRQMRGQTCVESNQRIRVGKIQ